MGLDQYLYAKVKDPTASPEERLRVHRTDEEVATLSKEDVDFNKLMENFNTWPKQAWYYLPTVWEIGYWRKANQIHNWFVENCNAGADDQQTYLVHPELLMDLKDRCEQVLATPALAAKLLPTVSGFFFGSTDYDEWYVQDLQDTLEIIARVDDWRGHDILYGASW